MLASLLPGLREVRTPLATGYLWLLVLWLLFQRNVPRSKEEVVGPIASIYELGLLVGAPVALAAASFAAYLLGSVLVASRSGRSHSYGFITPPGNAGPTAWGLRSLPARARGALEWLAGRDRRMEEALYLQLESFASKRLLELDDRLSDEQHAEVLGRDVHPRMKEVEDFMRAFGSHPLSMDYVSSMINELDLVGVQLQAQNRDLWDTYDRKSAEAAFRSAVSLPVAILFLVLAWQSGEWWVACLLVIPGALARSGRMAYAQGASTLVQAIDVGLVTPPIMQRLMQKARNVSSGEH